MVLVPLSGPSVLDVDGERHTIRLPAVERSEMDVGLVLMSHHGSWDDAAFAEAHGFASVGFVDSPLIAGDPFVAMALAARQTTSIRVGLMLAVPSNRNAAALVTALATVNRLAPGRTFLGIGTGFTGRAVFGLAPLSPRALREYVAACRQLLAGDETIQRDGSAQTRVRMRHAVKDRYVRLDGIPVYVGADGPQALAVTGELGDGWIMSLQYANWRTNAVEVFAQARDLVGRGAIAAGRSLEGMYTMCSVGVCVLDHGEAPTSERALERVGAYAMMPFHAYACNPGIADYLPPPIRDRLPIYEREVLDRLDVPRADFYQEVHRGHLSHLLPGEAQVLTDEIVQMTTLTGTAIEIADLLRRLQASGLRCVALNPPPHLVRETVRDFAEKVQPLLSPTGVVTAEIGADH
jgi:alkanesulfonate monooxygenase SsuD/methylene tetrahydromethanopterin reductase-like flavin-dependent oxidoreductase (luciferase family)